MTFRLHNFFRSSSSTRLRAGLNLKGIAYDYVPYQLRRGDTKAPEYLAMNPSGLVPTLELPEGNYLTQSMAILEWLEEKYPDPPLLPTEPDDRARVRALALTIACEIHPLNNLRVLQYLGEAFGADEMRQKAWFVHWVTAGFDALEAMMSTDARTGVFCHGNRPGLADCCLYAQVWNNTRFGIDTSAWPTIFRVFSALDELPAFREAAPPNQPDAN